MKKNLILLLLLMGSTICQAYEASQTLYTANRDYITFGELDFNKSIDEVVIFLLKYNQYPRWALEGMKGIDKESEGLTVFFTKIEYSSQLEAFIITFDINLIWPFGSKDNVLILKPIQKFDDTGELSSILFVPELETSLVKQVSFELAITKKEENLTSLSYLTRVKLSKFLDFFFTLKSYKKNMEWYIIKLAENLSNSLNG